MTPMHVWVIQPSSAHSKKKKWKWEKNPTPYYFHLLYQSGSSNFHPAYYCAFNWFAYVGDVCAFLSFLFSILNINKSTHQKGCLLYLMSRIDAIILWLLEKSIYRLLMNRLVYLITYTIFSTRYDKLMKWSGKQIYIDHTIRIAI